MRRSSSAGRSSPFVRHTGIGKASRSAGPTTSIRLPRTSTSPVTISGLRAESGRSRTSPSIMTTDSVVTSRAASNDSDGDHSGPNET